MIKGRENQKDQDQGIQKPVNIGWLKLKYAEGKNQPFKKSTVIKIFVGKTIYLTEKCNATFNNISVILWQSKNLKLRHSFYKWFNQIVVLIVKKNRLAIDKY